MHHLEDAVLPLTWVPTKGNDIPPLAVPLHEGSTGQLYIARGLLKGEMHIGTTSCSSNAGARLKDKYGRSHVVFEYEVLTCASSLRFMLESPPSTPAVETARTTPRWPVRRDIEFRVETPSPDTPPSKTPGKLAPFPWLSPPRGQPAAIPDDSQRKRYQNDPPPYTSPRGGWIEPPKRPPPVALNRRESVQFKYLAQSKCFTLIDDTTSMQFSWAQTRAALTGIIDILSSDSKWDGMNLRFIHHSEARPCIKTADEFERVFNSVPTWRGEKVMTAKVSQVFAESLALIHEAPLRRPVIFLIVTDGIAIDTQEFLDAVVCFCQKLKERCIPSHMFRIHILQMGDDRKVVKPLHDIRDRATQRDRERRILNVVSFHRGRGLLNAQNIIKLLLASTCIPVEEDPDNGERESPEVIEGQYREVANIRTMGNK